MDTSASLAPRVEAPSTASTKISSSQTTPRIAPTLSELVQGAGLEALHTLPKADLYISLNAHQGRPEVLTDWMDASVVDENDPTLTDESLKADEGQHGWDYIYEPDAQSVIDELLVRYLEALVYQSVAENIASEQSARMVAMKSASDNAKKVIGELKLTYNKARQAAITKELSEIVAGAAAV